MDLIQKIPSTQFFYTQLYELFKTAASVNFVKHQTMNLKSMAFYSHLPSIFIKLKIRNNTLEKIFSPFLSPPIYI